MLWNRYFFPSFVLLVAVAALHWIASDLYYYWTVPWYDIMMHFLGGAWVALAALWLLEMPFSRFFKARVSLTSVVLLSVVVGVLWEVYEIIFGFSDPSAVGYTADTSLDLVMDTIGAALTVWVFGKFMGSGSSDEKHE